MCFIHIYIYIERERDTHSYRHTICYYALPRCLAAARAQIWLIADLGDFASRELYAFLRSICGNPAENCGDLWRLPISRKHTNMYCGDLRRRRIHAKSVQKSIWSLAREIPCVLRKTTESHLQALLSLSGGLFQRWGRNLQPCLRARRPRARFRAARIRGGEGAVDWDTGASNCSTGNCLFSFNKRISSKSSNWEIWARWGFSTVSSPLPKETRAVVGGIPRVLHERGSRT